MPVQNEAGPTILGREYRGWGVSAGENSGAKVQADGLEPGDVNVSFTPWSVSYPVAGNRNLKLCSFCKFMRQPSATRPGSLGPDTQPAGKSIVRTSAIFPSMQNV